ncbi:MAG: Transcriptional regulator, AbrB family [Candidatus Saccharibacteria bacterium]|nr:Transcriptional regulator, AbrB family [Candidatus Saccharibacteria bacterium]
MGEITGNKKLYGTATIGSKGQVVIPAEAREDLGLKPGDRLYVLNAMHGNGGLVFLKEEMLESIVERLTEQVEGFRALKDKEQSDTK